MRYFVFDGEVDEVGVDEDMIGRSELRVVLKEERCWDLRNVLLRFFLGFELSLHLQLLLLLILLSIDMWDSRSCVFD